MEVPSGSDQAMPSPFFSQPPVFSFVVLNKVCNHVTTTIEKYQGLPWQSNG